MTSDTFFANILLSHEFPIGRSSIHTRKKGDWYHSISVFANESIHELKDNCSLECTVIHFFGENGSPVLDTIQTTITCIGHHNGYKLYRVSRWPHSCAVIGDVRTLKGYEPGYGNCNIPIKDIISAAYGKWGYGKIPYAHQRNESYNCVGFVDDILSWSQFHHWSDRIENLHHKYGLYI